MSSTQKEFILIGKANPYREDNADNCSSDLASLTSIKETASVNSNENIF